MVTRFYDEIFMKVEKQTALCTHIFYRCFDVSLLVLKKKNLFIYTDGEFRVISLKYITCILLKPMALFIWKVKIKYANNKELYIFG